MTSLEDFTPYTSYRLHWFPYEITRCKNLRDSCVSTRALYGNFSYWTPFPKLPSISPRLTPEACSVCGGPFTANEPRQAWISLWVATDVLPLLVHACSERCISDLPWGAKGYLPLPHGGGLSPEPFLAMGPAGVPGLMATLQGDPRPEAVPILIQALAGPRSKQAARLLGGMGAVAGSAVPALIATPGEAASWALGRIGGPAAVAELIDRLDAQFCVECDAATKGLAHAGGVQAMAALLQCVMSGSGSGTELGEALLTIDPGEDLSALQPQLERWIEEIDQRLGRQLDEILHHQQFQTLEAAWRGLQFLIDHVEAGQNIQVHLLQATGNELLRDFEQSTDVQHSGYGRHVLGAAHGVDGQPPLGVVIAVYELASTASDLFLRQELARVSALVNLPLIAGANPSLFDNADERWTDFSKLPLVLKLRSRFERPGNMRWISLGRRPEAQYLGLCLPRILVRCRYDADVDEVTSFAYDEQTSDRHTEQTWGNAAFALGACLARSFARYRWALI